MSLEREDESTSTLTAETLLAKGGIESLIKSERVPSAMKINNKYNYFIPPQGTQFGDSIEELPGVGLAFFSPDGQFRGTASIVEVSLLQKWRLDRRINKAIKQFFSLTPQQL